MPKVNFLDLDETAKSTVFWLADQAETVTASVTKSVSHVGEIWEAAAFMKEHPHGSTPHTALAERLRLGDNSAETILDCISRSAPSYLELTERADEELDELLADLKNTPFR